MFENYWISRRIMMNMCMVIGAFVMAIAFIFIVFPQGNVLGFDLLLRKLQNRFYDIPIFYNLLTTGYLLLAFVGAPLVVAAIFVIARMRHGLFLAIIASGLLTTASGLCCYAFSEYAFSWILLGISIILLVISYLTSIFYRNYIFYFNEDDYRNIGRKGNELVVYFTRTKYIKKYAYSLANSLGADVLEINTETNYLSNIGYFRVINDSFRQRLVKLTNKPIDINIYDKVHLVTKVFGGKISSPMMSFAFLYSGKIKNVEYHYFRFFNFLQNHYDKLAYDLDSALKIKRDKAYSIVSKYGQVVKHKIVK